MTWKRGPLPPDTYMWGGCVPTDCVDCSGFYFADFCGDHVKLCPGDRVLKADEVAWYDNSLELPPAESAAKSRAGAVAGLIAVIMLTLAGTASAADYSAFGKQSRPDCDPFGPQPVKKTCDCAATGVCTCGESCDCPACPDRTNRPTAQPVVRYQPAPVYYQQPAYTQPRVIYQQPYQQPAYRAAPVQYYDPSPRPSYFSPNSRQPSYSRPVQRQSAAPMRRAASC